LGGRCRGGRRPAGPLPGHAEITEIWPEVGGRGGERWEGDLVDLAAAILEHLGGSPREDF